MPTNGLVFSADILELRAEGSASGSHSGDGTGVYTWSGTGRAQYADTTSTLATGFLLQVSGSSSTNQWSVTYTGPGSPSGTTWTGTGWTSASCYVELTDVRLYNTGTAWKLVADYEVFAGGVSRLTGSIDSTTSLFGPAFIPLIGIPIQLSGSATASTTSLPTYGETSTYDYNSETTGTVSGGWRYKEVGGSVWLTPDVTILGLSVPAITCAQSTSVSAISATNTYNLSIPVYAYARKKRAFVGNENAQIQVEASCFDTTTEITTVICDETGDAICPDETIQNRDVYSIENWTESKGGSIRAVPNLDKAIKRINDDFKALIYRTEMPQTQVQRSATCTDGGVNDSDTTNTEIHPYQDEILQVVEETSASMEDTLGYETYAPISATGSKSYTKTFEFYEYCETLECPPSWFSCEVACDGVVTYECTVIWPDHPTESVSYSASVSFPSSVGSSSDMAGYLGHTGSGLARYINSWCNPLWSFLLWTESWEVDSSAETWDDYWEKIGSQWIYNAAASITDETRNHLVSEPLGNDGNSSFLETNVSGLRWLGISRFITKEVTPRTTYDYTSGSSSLWSATDATLTHGSDITVNPSASPCEVALDLGSFTVEPFLWPHLCDRITVGWTTTNISDVKVYLEAIDGTRVLLNDNENGVAKSRPSAQATKYAGSWDQDYGAGIITDSGSDDTVDGISSATMASAERAFAFQLLADYTAEKLVFVIEVSDVDTDVNIDYPTIEYTKSSTRLHTPENAHQSSVVHSEGAGVRFGIWDTGTSGTINNPPALYDPDERPNTVDWLCAERLVVEGIAHDSNLTTELSTLRDTFEGQSVGNERTSSYGLWLTPEPASANWYLALVASLAECPPLGHFPRQERDKTDWSENGDLVQHTWVYAQGPDYLVNPGYQADLVHSSTVWTSGASSVLGWNRSKHSEQVDNTETGSKIVQGTTEYATVRPFRGFYSVLPPGEDIGGIAYTTHQDGMHYRAYINGGGKLVTERSDNLLSWMGVTTTIDADYVWLSHSFSGEPRVFLQYTDGGVVYLRESYDGLNWGMATTISAGSSNEASAMIEVPGGRYFHYWIDSSGNIKGRETDAGGNTIGTADFSTSITGVDSVQFGARWSSYGRGLGRAVIQCTISGVVTQYTSTDGRTFS